MEHSFDLNHPIYVTIYHIIRLMNMVQSGSAFNGLSGSNFPLKYPLLIFLLALLLRVILVYYVAPYPDRYIQSDGVGYDQLAMNLLSGRGFSTAQSAPFVPDNFRTPGYPAILATFYAFFGHHPPVVLYFQALIGALTCLVTYFLAARFTNHQVGLLSSLLLAINPHSITYSAVLWSDTIFTFLLMVSIFFTIVMLKRLSLPWIILSGFFLGLTTMVHPRTLYLPVFFSIYLCVILVRNKIGLRKTFIRTSLYLCFFLVPLLPWIARNNLVFGVPNLTAVQGVNMLYYGAALTESNLTGDEQWALVRDYIHEIKQSHPEPLNEAKFSNAAFQYALKKIVKSPSVYAKVHFVGMLKVFLPGTFTINNLITGQTQEDLKEVFGVFVSRTLKEYDIFQEVNEFSKVSWSIIGFEMITLIMIYMLTLYAIFLERTFSWKWLLILTVFYLLLVAGPVGAPRFRVALMPMISILSSLGAVSIYSSFKRSSSARL